MFIYSSFQFVDFVVHLSLWSSGSCYDVATCGFVGLNNGVVLSVFALIFFCVECLYWYNGSDFPILFSNYL